MQRQARQTGPRTGTGAPAQRGDVASASFHGAILSCKTSQEDDFEMSLPPYARPVLLPFVP